MAHLYTKLFADGRLPMTAVEAIVTAAVAGRREAGIIYGGCCAIDVRTNDDYAPEALQSNPTDFVCFPYSIDVEAVGENPSLEPYLTVVGTVMRALASSGMRVVAACDWEERLPGKGKLGT